MAYMATCMTTCMATYIDGVHAAMLMYGDDIYGGIHNDMHAMYDSMYEDM